MKLLKTFIILCGVIVACIAMLLTAHMSFADTTVVISSNSAGTNNTSNPTPTHDENGSYSENTVTVNQSDTNCDAAMLEGYLEYTDNHRSGTHIVGHFYNHADVDCQITLHVFGSNNEQPETDNWLESQVHVDSKTYTVPAHSEDFKVEYDVQNGTYCWYQVEATRTTEVKTPPYYSGNDMIDYVFVEGSACNCTPTPTPTATPTPGPTATPTPGQPTSSTPTPTPSVLGSTTLANTGMFEQYVIEAGIVWGSFLTLLSLWKQFKSKRA